jgi:hypothetical protein
MESVDGSRDYSANDSRHRDRADLMTFSHQIEVKPFDTRLSARASDLSSLRERTWLGPYPQFALLPLLPMNTLRTARTLGAS